MREILREDGFAFLQEKRCGGAGRDQVAGVTRT
jgi:hypothetical protein